MKQLLIATALLSIATVADAKGREIPAATPTGPEVNCLNTQRIRETRVRSDSVIDFYTLGGQVYRNTLPGGGCPSLGFEEKFAYSTSTSQLCNVDIITVLQSGGGLTRGASCGLGKFQPVQLAKK
jgi:hypothetical protein